MHSRSYRPITDAINWTYNAACYIQTVVNDRIIAASKTMCYPSSQLLPFTPHDVRASRYSQCHFRHNRGSEGRHQLIQFESLQSVLRNMDDRVRLFTLSYRITKCMVYELRGRREPYIFYQRRCGGWFQYHEGRSQILRGRCLTTACTASRFARSFKKGHA